MNIMGYSIQEYLKKINSRLTLLDCVSFLITVIFLVIFAMYLYTEKTKANIPVSYIKVDDKNIKTVNTEARPFASVNGETYTFSWCQGANVITDKNKIYFPTETEAIVSGRKLSKLCSSR